MKTSFTDEQIIQMIKERAPCERTVDECSRYGISQGTFQNSKSKFGSLRPSE